MYRCFNSTFKCYHFIARYSHCPSRMHCLISSSISRFCIPFHLEFRFRFRGFLSSSSATRPSRGRAPRLTSDIFTCCQRKTERGDHDFLSQPVAILTSTQPVAGERPDWGSKPRPSDQETGALPTELSLPLFQEALQEKARGVLVS